MNQKQEIIDNIGNYTAAEIMKYLKADILRVSDILDDINGNPEEFANPKRRELEEMLWQNADSEKTEEIVSLYISNYPLGKYSDAAKELLEEIRKENEVRKPEIKEETSFLGGNDSDDEEWDATDKSSENSLKSYLLSYPQGKHTREARLALKELTRSRNLPRGVEWLLTRLKSGSDRAEVQADTIIDALEKSQITNKELTEMFRVDPNFLPLETVKILYDEGHLASYELEEAGIKKEFIDVIEGNDYKTVRVKVDLSNIKPPTRINFTCQEIYFWGIPSSGKTCALGAILSSANSGKTARSMEKIQGCGGYDYMRILSEIFKPGAVSYLPPRTDAEFVADMSFLLQDNKEKLHAITLIDLAGEMVEAMYKVNSGKEYDLTPEQSQGYQTMKNLLLDNSSKNSKIHFFVLEYGAHERLHKGINQDALLNGALTHLKNLGILKKTDAVFLIVTKADKAFNEPGDFGQVISNYVRDHYSSFYENLRLNTKSINGGRIDIYPFSLGNVCFQDLCIFDDEAADQIVQLFLNRTPGQSSDRIGKISNMLRN